MQPRRLGATCLKERGKGGGLYDPAENMPGTSQVPSRDAGGGVPYDSAENMPGTLQVPSRDAGGGVPYDSAENMPGTLQVPSRDAGGGVPYDPAENMPGTLQVPSGGHKGLPYGSSLQNGCKKATVQNAPWLGVWSCFEPLFCRAFGVVKG